MDFISVQHVEHILECVYKYICIFRCQLYLWYSIELFEGGCCCFLVNIEKELPSCGKSLESELTKCYKALFYLGIEALQRIYHSKPQRKLYLM